MRIEIRRDPMSQSSPLSSAPTAPLKEQHEGIVVPSPMSGIFYRRPSPNEPPFVEEGDPVLAGQVLGLIEAMKVFNEIESPLSGILQKFCLSEGEMAREGEPLCIISSQGEKP